MKKRILMVFFTVLLAAAVTAIPLAARGGGEADDVQPLPAATADHAAPDPTTEDSPALNATGDEGKPPKTRGATSDGDLYLLDVDPLFQDELESGCEVYSAVMLLQYEGFEIDEFSFAEDYLEVRPNYTGYDGGYYGPDLNSAFAGEVEWGYGAYAPALARAINRYLSDEDASLDAVVQKGLTLETLCEKCLRRDRPVMVWMTTDMALPEEYITWTVDYVDENAEYEEGDEFSWPVNEHCMLLCGCDDEVYYFADPLEGMIVSYEKDLCEEIFEAMDAQAVYLS